MTIFEITLFWLKIAPTYYGLMYALWFIYGVYALKKTQKYTQKQQESIFIYIFLGVLLGWRIWYILFYNLESYISSPASIFKVWEWWMSFHWGFLWVCIALYLFSRRNAISFWSLSDDIAKIIPVWLFFGRLGNYINKELLWFEYSWPLAVSVWSSSYFPSPLVEALWEWVLIFILFTFLLKRPKFAGQFAALFLVFYWTVRTLVELFIRTPDTHIGYYFWFITQWSLLSFPMIVAGIGLYYYLSKNPSHAR